MNAAFAVVFAVLVVQRLLELRISRAHESRLRARGAVEVGAAHYPWMILMHVLWFAAWLAEVVAFGARAWWGSIPLLVLSIAAEALRIWAIHTLGERWTTRVLVLPGELAIARGPYRFARHPNYLAVMALVIALPAAFGAWRAAVFGAFAYGLVLHARIRAEVAAWANLEGVGARSPT